MKRGVKFPQPVSPGYDKHLGGLMWKKGVPLPHPGTTGICLSSEGQPSKRGSTTLSWKTLERLSVEKWVQLPHPRSSGCLRPCRGSFQSCFTCLVPLGLSALGWPVLENQTQLLYPGRSWGNQSWKRGHSLHDLSTKAMITLGKAICGTGITTLPDWGGQPWKTGAQFPQHGSTCLVQCCGDQP